jgi:hypothetical protein
VSGADHRTSDNVPRAESEPDAETSCVVVALM